MIRKAPITVVIAIVVGWWGISLFRSPKPSDTALRPEPVATAQPETELRSVNKAQLKPEVAALARQALPTTPSAVPFEFQSELNSYADLKTKVLPSEAETSLKKTLLNNSALLRSLGERLVRVPLMSLGEQDIVVDLLIEALQGGDRVTAEAAISAVVGDKQVEDTSVPASTREQLAGIKGELMYHWTAYQPDQASQVSRLLPGPVSRKIWDNVLSAQKANLEQSDD